MSPADALLQSAVDAILMLDGEGRIASANPGAVAAFGVPADALRGMVFADCIATDSQEEFLGAWRALRRDARSSTLLEIDGVRADGTVFPLELSLTVWWEG